MAVIVPPVLPSLGTDGSEIISSDTLIDRSRSVNWKKMLDGETMEMATDSSLQRGPPRTYKLMPQHASF